MSEPFPEPNWDDPLVRVTRIDWVFDRILQSVEETFAGYGIELPTLRYKTLGAVVHDCEQVTVSLIQAYIGPPGDQAAGPQPCHGPRTGVFQVEIVRCVTDGSSQNLKQRSSTAPDPEAANEYAASRALDLWALLDVPDFMPDYNGVIADVSVTDEEGKFQAAVLNLVVQI